MTSAPMRYDGARARRERILASLQEHGFSSISDLTAELGVSDMTIRRDLRQLEQSSSVRIVHGGASLPQGMLRFGFVTRGVVAVEEKRRIGRRAAQFVGSADTVALDAGTTAYEVAGALPDSFTGRVVTHSVPVIQLLVDRPGVGVVGLGGELLTDSRAFVGSMTVEAAKRLRVRTFFLGAAAIDARGVYVETDAEYPTKTALIDIADTVILVADHRKFAMSAPVLLCGLDRVDTLVTDQPTPEHIHGAIEQAECTVILAEDQE